MSTRKKTPSPQKADADLSESAFAYATKEIEVKEVDFSVEINRLMGLGRSISRDVRDDMSRLRFHRTCCLQHTAPIWTAKDGEMEGGRKMEGRGDGVVVCGTKPPGFTYLDNPRRRVTRPDP